MPRRLLDRARRAEADNEPDEVEEALRWYLSLRPEDGPTWAWYARVLDRRDAGRPQLERTYLVYQQALRREAGDPELKRRVADLAMELGRHGDARGLLDDCSRASPADTAASRRAELEELAGPVRAGAGEQYANAEKSFMLGDRARPRPGRCL